LTLEIGAASLRRITMRRDAAASGTPPVIRDDASGSDAGRIVVVSVSFRDHDTDDRQRLGAVVADLGPFPERVVVQTCHRTELVAVAPAVPPPGAGARVFADRDAVERVFLVAGGLDSAILAEEQVLGQVRDALATALARRESGPLLNELFRRAIRFGKRVRSLAQPAADRSLAQHATRWALSRLGDVADARALVVGTGETGRLLAREFAAAGIGCTVASGSAARAADAIASLPSVTGQGHATAEIADLPQLLPAHVVVAFAVRRHEPLLLREHLTEGFDVIDLSTPSAVAPEAAQVLGDRLLNLDRLGKASASSPLSPKAERQVREELAAETDRYLAWVADRRSGVAGALYRQAEAVRARHVDRLRAGVELTQEQLAAVERMSAALVADVVHLRATDAREEMLAGSRA
jgi:glutamyl-tRNA reductase